MRGAEDTEDNREDTMAEDDPRPAAEEPHPDGPIVTNLIDADNGFNKQSRLAMLWTVRHQWAVMARFTMNCYCHFVRLVVRLLGGEPIILMSKEGSMQGDSLGMILYGIGMLPLVEI